MARGINTVMQSCFFALSGILPREEAIAAIRHSIEKTYGKRGERVVAKNFEAVDAALANLQRSRCRTRSPFQSPMRSRTGLVDVHWISRPDLAT